MHYIKPLLCYCYTVPVLGRDWSKPSIRKDGSINWQWCCALGLAEALREISCISREGAALSVVTALVEAKRGQH